MATVKLENICKSYDNGFQAAKDVNIDIKDKEFIVLVGPSGCGKSTTLRMIAGLEDITSGTLKIDDRVVNDAEPKDRDIAMVFQNYALYPHMSVYDNMSFSLKLRKMDKQEIDKKVKEAAKILQLENLLDRKPKALSGGQRQRVARGRSLLMEPRLIIADETIASLDISIQAQIVMLFKKLQQEKRFSFLFIAHDLSMVRFLSDTTGVMKNGKLVEMAPTKELFENPQHPYTQSLLSAIHIPDPLEERKRRLIEYEELQSLGEGWKELSACHCVRI